MKCAKDPAALERFRREALAASALNHPNICTIYEIDEADGHTFIAMEFLEGATLKHVIGDRPLTIEKCSTSASRSPTRSTPPTRAASSIAISSRPTFLSPSAATPRFSTSDSPRSRPEASCRPCGARPAVAVTDPEEHLTSPGTAMGTAAYMSPEQARGKELDARSDLFSFGAVLYEMVTGMLPFRGDTSAAIFDGILNRAPAPPLRMNPDIPPKLEDVIHRALEKDPRLRYQSASDMRADLQRLKRDTDSGRSAVMSPASGQFATGATHPTTAAIPAAASRTKKYWIAAVAVVVVIAAVVAGLLWRGSSAKKINSIAVLPFVNATSDTNNEFLSDGLTEDLIGTLSQLPNMKVMARSTVFRFKNKDDDPTKIGQTLNVDAVLTGRITRHGNDVKINTNLVNVADGTEIWGAQYTRNIAEVSTLQQDIMNDVAAKLRSRLTGEQQKQMARGQTQNAAAYQLYVKGRYLLNKRGNENIKQSLQLFQQAIDADPSYALAYAGLAEAYIIAPSWIGKGFDPRECTARALAAAHKALELDPELPEGHDALANALADDYQWAEAEKEFQRALELAPNDAQMHYHYSFLYLLPMARYDDALQEIHNALLLDPLSGIINVNYGYTLSCAHRFDDAVQQFRKTEDMDPSFFVTHRKFAGTYASMGKWADADREYRAFALAMRDKDLPPPGTSAKDFARLMKAHLANMAKNDQFGDIVYAAAVLIDGDRESAIAYVQKSAADHGAEFPYGIREPLFDPLRSDPRYIETMKRVGLPP